jgi:hypothetical protein
MGDYGGKLQDCYNRFTHLLSVLSPIGPSSVEHTHTHNSYNNTLLCCIKQQFDAIKAL